MTSDDGANDSTRLTSDRLLPLVYDELRRLAASRMADERSDHTLSSTALVHEAYLRLAGTEPQPLWDSKAHFFSAAAEAMRRILVENARRKLAQKRGGDFQRHVWNDDIPESPQTPAQWIDLDDALSELEQVDRQAAEVVKLRFFAGLSLTVIAETLDLAPRSTDRLWSFARAWLLRRLGESTQ